MNSISRITRVLFAASAAGLGLACQAGQGLATPQAETWWPQWQARLSVMGPQGAASVLARPGEVFTNGLALPSGRPTLALLGDYYFARPAFGQFRASGGLLWGASPGSSTALGGLYAHGALTLHPADTVPYAGLGYSGTLWHDNLSLNADLGLIPERPAAAAHDSRALFGTQGMGQALRELRVSPVLQLGMRYRF